MASDSIGMVDDRDKLRLESYLPNSKSENPPAKQSSLPHLTLTYAQTLDSKISLHPNTRTNISGPETKNMTHYLRTRHDAILVGVGTANADDPGLNSRYPFDGQKGVRLDQQPRPIILDSSMKWQPTSKSKVLDLAKHGLGKAPWWVVDYGVAAKNQDRVEMIRGVGGEVIEVRPRDWNSILSRIQTLGINSIMVEGGAEVINGLLEVRNQKFISSIIITLGPSYFGVGGTAINPPRAVQDKKEVAFQDVQWIPMGQDVVMTGRISPSYLEVSPPDKDFQEPALSFGWQQPGERSVQQDFSSADCTFSPIDPKFSR